MPGIPVGHLVDEQKIADEQGRFRIRGVEPGSVSVMASSGGLRSQWFHLVLYEGQAVRDLQLVVK